MAAINKNFVIKNGLEVDTKTLYVDVNTKRVGIGSTIPTSVLDVVGNAKVQGTTDLPNLVVGVATGGTIGVSTLTATGITGTAATITSVTVQSFTVTGSSAIGNEGSDQIALNAEVSTNIIPATADLHDFGYPTKKWRDIHLARHINASTLVGFGLSVGVGTARSYVGQELVISGFSTFTNGPVVIGSGTTTGTASQTLQVTGGAYVSDDTGIGTTNPTSKLHVVGDTLVTGVSTATAFNGNINAGVGTITTLNGTSVNYVNLYSNTGIVTTISGTTATYTNGDFVVLDGETTYANVGVITSLVGTAVTYTNGDFVVLDGETTYANVGVITSLVGTAVTYTRGDFVVLDGETTYANVGVITSLVGTAVTYTNATFTNVSAVNSNLTGVSTAIAFNGNINAGVGTITTLNGTSANYVNLYGNVGVVTTLSGTNVNYTTGDVATAYINTGIVTTLSGTNLNYTRVNGTNFNFSGLSTASLLTGATANFTGVGTFGSLSIGATSIVSSDRQLQNISSLDSITTTVISAAVAAAPNSFINLNVIGISTFINGPVLISSGTPTGTASQSLQVTGGAYVSGNTGFGITNPTSKLHVIGDTLVTGVSTAIAFNGNVNAGVGTITTLSGTTATYTNGDFTVLDVATIYANVGVVTTLSGTNLNYTTGDVQTAYINTGIVTTLSGTTATYTTANLTNLSATNAYVTTGIVTTLSGSSLNYSGIATVGSVSIGNTQVISSNRQLQNIASLDATTTATIEAAIVNAPNAFTDLSVTGVSTFTNGPVLVGSGTSTGTASQRFQVTGGAYVSGNLGIGTTNPTSKLHVVGNTLVTGVSTATAFNGNINAGVGTITTLNATNITLSSTVESVHGDFSGIVTATKFATGADGAAINIEATRITGPTELVIDPQNIADNTGRVRIKGDLYVDGDQFVVNSGIIELADFVVGIATTVTSNASLDGAGIAIGNSSITSKTLTYSFGSAALKSSENFDLVSGKTYKINGTDVLSSTTLSVPQVNASGVSTLTTLSGTTASYTTGDFTTLDGDTFFSNTGIITSLTGTKAKYTTLDGDTFFSNTGIITSLTGTKAKYTTLDGNTFFSNTGIITSLTGTNLNYTGVSTFTNGPVLVGSATSTGTASQRLQVTGGAYVSGNLGIGTTNPTSKLHVVGDVTLGTGVTITGATANSFTVNSSRSILNGDTIISNTLPTTVSYASSFVVASQENEPQDVSFSNDGKTMYVLGNAGNDITWYSLSTPWNITTASHVSQFSVSGQLTVPLGFYFKPDGTKFYVVGRDGVGAAATSVNQYTCATPWDLTTASYDSVAFSVISQGTNPKGIEFKPDGTKFYVVENTAAMPDTNDTVYQYSCSTPWNVSTASYDSVSFSVNAQEFGPEGIRFSLDGTKLLVIGTSGDDINYYTLSTPWNVSTASFVGIITSLSSVIGEATPSGLYWKPDGTKLYASGFGNDAVYEFNMTSDADLEVTGTLDVYGNADVYETLTVYGETTFNSSVVINTSGSITIPDGTTAQRPGIATAGDIRFNTSLVQFEGYNGTTWGTIGGGAKGGGADQVFFENDQTVGTSYSITSGKNAMSAGPITVGVGATVTIPSGSVWTIV